MTVAREILPGVVVVLLAAATRALGYQFAAARGEVAAIVAASGVQWPLAAEPHTTQAGVRCAVLPLGVVAGVAVHEAPSIAHVLEEPVEAGQLWCLLLWREGGEERAMLMPMRPTTAVERGSA